MDDMIREIVNGLNEDFYYHLREPVTEETFGQIVGALGEVKRTEEVKLYASDRRLHQPEALRFHNDQPFVDIIGWRCVVPDPNGPTLIMNLSRLLEDVPPSEIELWRQVTVLYPPNPDHLDELLSQNLLDFEDGYYRLFYLSFRGSKSMSEELQEAWQRFHAFVRESAEKHAFGVTLKEGECLFLHNRTVVHARPALDPKTPRCLRRAWIQSTLVKGFRTNRWKEAPRAGRADCGALSVPAALH